MIQLVIHDPIRSPTKPLGKPVTRHVAIAEMTNVIRPERIRPKSCGANRAGIVWYFVG